MGRNCIYIAALRRLRIYPRAEIAVDETNAKPEGGGLGQPRLIRSRGKVRLLYERELLRLILKAICDANESFAYICVSVSGHNSFSFLICGMSDKKEREKKKNDSCKQRSCAQERSI